MINCIKSIAVLSESKLLLSFNLKISKSRKLPGVYFFAKRQVKKCWRSLYMEALFYQVRTILKSKEIYDWITSFEILFNDFQVTWNILITSHKNNADIEIFNSCFAVTGHGGHQHSLDLPEISEKKAKSFLTYNHIKSSARNPAWCRSTDYEGWCEDHIPYCQVE